MHERKQNRLAGHGDISNTACLKCHSWLCWDTLESADLQTHIQPFWQAAALPPHLQQLPLQVEVPALVRRGLAHNIQPASHDLRDAGKPPMPPLSFGMLSFSPLLVLRIGLHACMVPALWRRASLLMGSEEGCLASIWTGSSACFPAFGFQVNRSHLEPESTSGALTVSLFDHAPRDARLERLQIMVYSLEQGVARPNLWLPMVLCMSLTAAALSPRHSVQASLGKQGRPPTNPTFETL
jgi:hypothetical protein